MDGEPSPKPTRACRDHPAALVGEKAADQLQLTVRWKG